MKTLEMKEYLAPNSELIDFQLEACICSQKTSVEDMEEKEYGWQI